MSTPKKRKEKAENKVSPQARRKQIFIGLGMGLFMGLVIGFISQFWWWVPAGLALGLATGAIMKPPTE